MIPVTLVMREMVAVAEVAVKHCLLPTLAGVGILPFSAGVLEGRGMGLREVAVVGRAAEMEET